MRIKRDYFPPRRCWWGGRGRGYHPMSINVRLSSPGWGLREMGNPYYSMVVLIFNWFLFAVFLLIVAK